MEKLLAEWKNSRPNGKIPVDHFESVLAEYNK
jgi:hypothetical protein